MQSIEQADSGGRHPGVPLTLEYRQQLPIPRPLVGDYKILEAAFGKKIAGFRAGRAVLIESSVEHARSGNIFVCRRSFGMKR